MRRESVDGRARDLPATNERAIEQDALVPSTPRGLRNSSLTRVRPFFRQLFESRRPTGTWLREILDACPNSTLARAIREHPGDVDPALLRPASVSGRPALEPAFEYPVAAPRAFLEFLLRNPDQLRWPLVRGERRTFSSLVTMRQRESLVDGPDEAREAAIELGLERLRTRGTRRTRTEPAWWVFEGVTKVDCCLMTDRLVLFIEGKRTETVASSTDWYPSRNQLVRNLEAIGEVASEREAGVLLVGEELVPELDDVTLERSLPHLDAAERDRVGSRYLGQTTWLDLCRATGVNFDSLPTTWTASGGRA